MSFHLLNKLHDISVREKSFIDWSHRFYYALCVALLVFAGLAPAIAFFFVGGLFMSAYWLLQAKREVDKDNDRLSGKDR